MLEQELKPKCTMCGDYYMQTDGHKCQSSFQSMLPNPNEVMDVELIFDATLYTDEYLEYWSHRYTVLLARLRENE